MSDILTGFNMQGNDPIDDRIVSKSNLETLEQYLNRVPVQKRYYGLTFFALDKNNELRKYTFQTSLIEPTIDDDEEEIERIDKELQEHVSNKAIHKTSEEIRSEIVDADIPDTIARVQWTLDQINTAVVNLIGGASDEYNTLKRIQTKIEELRAKIYGDDGGEVLKTLEQALKFLNQYKDFIVDIPENFVNKQDIVDNLTTDDPTKVLSAKQGKVLSDTLTNYFESAMQSIRTETDRAINAENRIETKLDKEIDRSIKEDKRIDAKLDAEIERSTNEDIRIDNKLDSEINRSTAEDDRLDQKIDAETTRATTAESNLNTKIETETDRAEGEESRIEAKLDNEITRSTNKDTEHDNRLQALEGQTHEQNTDLGTTNSTFQLKYNTGNKIKHESDAISVRNAADTDYVNFIAKNATFKGDLLVEGQSFVTEAETVEIKDNLLLLNKGEVGAGVTKGIAGLEIDRGTEPNYQIIFDESDNRFKAGEIGDIQCLALRDGDDSMTGGMFTSWDSTTKRLKTTNIVPSSSFLYFGDNKTVSLNYSPVDDGSLMIYTNKQSLSIFTGNTYTNFRSTRNKFQFIGDLYSTGTKYALTFKRSSDNSEVLYHADIINDLTTGGTNKILSAEQGKLLQNSITSVQDSYLPLSGGNMTGNIVFNNNLFLNWKDTKGSTYQVLSMKSNDEINIGNAAFPLNLYSKEDLFHKRNGENVYRIYDAYNLPDPATLSGNNVFTGNNTFQAGKFNVGPFEVTSSGSLLSNINTPAGSAWSRSLVFRANNDIPSSLVFGGYNSVDNTSIGYVYIGIGDINYQTAQYKFYANSLKVPYKWSIDGPDGSAILWSQTSEIVNLGRAAGTTKIRSGNTDLIHTKNSTEYIIWDKSNLPTPASTTDLANYLPLIGGTLTGQVIFDSYGLAFNNIAWTNDLVPNRTYGGYLQVLDAYNASSDGGPNNYGTVLQINSRNSHWANQLWFSGGTEISKKGLYYRHMAYNQTEYGDWIKLATTSDLGNYLPLTGGTLSGNLTINTVGSTTFVINNNDTNGSETFMRVLRKGTASAAIGFRDSLGAYIYNYNSNKYLFIDNDGYARVGTTSGSTRLALITDIPTVSGYLPLSGGIVTGDIKLNTEAALYTAASSGSGYSYYKTISYDNDKGIILGASNTSIKIQSSDPRIYHIYKGTEYEIYSTNSLPTPVFAPGKVAGSLTPIYNNSFYINDSSYKVATIDNSYSFPKIYSPTSAGTSGQILQSTGGVPTWVNASSIGGNYVSKSGDTMTGKLIAQGGINLNNVGKTGISFYSTSYVTWVEYMTNTGSGLASTGGTSSSYGNVTSWARRSTIEQTSGYGWIWDSCANSSGANPDPKMALSSNNGNLYVKGTITSNGKTVATTDQIPSIPSISISNSGSGNAVTSITASGHTLTVTKGATYLTSSSLDGYATQTWANGQFAPLSRFNTSTGYTTIKVTGQEFNFDSANPEIFMNYRTLSGSTAVTKITWKGGSNSTLCEGRWGNLYMNDNLVATQSWSNSQYPLKTGTGASGTWDINISGNASTASAASKLGSTTIGGSAKPIYLSSGTPTACSATVGSATVPVYMNVGTITQCSTTLGVSITGNAATATNATQLGGTAASSYVKANDNISRLTNDSGYTTQEWVNGQGFLTSDSILDKFVPTTGGYIRNSDQVLLRLQRTGVSTGTSRTIEMYFDDSNTDGTSTTPRGSIGYNSEVGMFLYSAKSKKFLAMEYTGRPFYGTPENRYYLLGSNTQYHNLDGYQRIGDIMIQWGYFTVQGNSTRAVNFPVSFTNTVWSVTGSWDNTTTGSQENWGFTDYTSSGFTIINGDGSSRVFHYIAIGPFTRS